LDSEPPFRPLAFDAERKRGRRARRRQRIFMLLLLAAVFWVFFEVLR
jgi:hypothetical protein